MSECFFDNSEPAAITDSQKLEIARHILNFFNLPTQQSKKQSAFRNSSDSQYLYDIYNNSLDRHNPTSADLRLISRSDAIVTYRTSCREERRLCFDVSETPEDLDTLIGSELRVYRKGTSRPVSVAVRQLVGGQWRLAGLLDQAEDDEGWIKLDTTGVLRDWMTHSRRKKLQMAISCTGSGARGELDCRPQLEESFLVGYFARAGMVSRSAIPRRKRDTLEAARPSAPPSKPCRLQQLYVPFRELDGNVIAPAGLAVQYCAGECPFPLAERANATNHALVQALMHFKRPDSVPGLCCVPRELGDLAVLYARGGANVYLKYPAVVAKSCECR